MGRKVGEVGRLRGVGKSSRKSFGGSSGKNLLIRSSLTWQTPKGLPPLSPSLCPGSVGLKFEGVLGSPGGLVKPIAEPHSGVSYADSLGWAQGFLHF